MHIPDGYLSPVTCAALYGASVSVWYPALKRLKQSAPTRTIPLVSVFAALAFVVMMLNVPLPGGTTGHATGIAIAAIVLGPWASTLAISLALAIQALFFGDGGITALGANCFNMAIVGSFVAYGTYRAISAGSLPGSRRRIIAAAIAGYVSINAAALATAIELGIQPTLFHTASGVPLYAPYPLRIAIPAVMLGHLTIAGAAEGALSAGMLRFFQRSDPSWLTGAVVENTVREPRPMWATRRLWFVVSLLMLLAPLGVLTAGTAWGEWSTADLASPEGQSRVAAASGNHAPPATVPIGLRRLSSVWTAPFPDYAPPFIKSEALGYLLSAMFGVGLIMFAAIGTTAVIRKKPQPGSCS